MDRNELIKRWKAEEEIAHIHGWDFSHIEGRYMEEDDLPWDYREEILRHLKPEMRILDIDTGGGEFLISLNHPYTHTAATENYPPNVDLCREKLLPLGIDFRAADGKGVLPFDDASFDMVINRHGDFNPSEIHRVLKPGGLFITQQVGAENDRELVELLCGKTELPFPEQYLDLTGKVVGCHRGAVCYTIGQRKGLGLAMGTPVYVCDKNMERNTVTVGPNEALFSDTLIGCDWNWFPFETLTEPIRVMAKARYRHIPQPATVYPEENGFARVEFHAPQRAVTPGQAVVLYDGDMVVGGGIITDVI